LPNQDGLTALHCACRSGHNDVIELLVSRGSSVSVRTRSGLGPLHMAAQGDHAHSVRLLLLSGAATDDVTAVMFTIFTPGLSHADSRAENIRKVGES